MESQVVAGNTAPKSPKKRSRMTAIAMKNLMSEGQLPSVSAKRSITPRAELLRQIRRLRRKSNAISKRVALTTVQDISIQDSCRCRRMLQNSTTKATSDPHIAHARQMEIRES